MLYVKRGRAHYTAKFHAVEGEEWLLNDWLHVFLYSSMVNDPITGDTVEVWYVTECFTGLSLAQGSDKDGVVALAEEQVGRFTKKKMRQLILDSVSDYGLSPTYKRHLTWEQLMALLRKERKDREEERDEAGESC